MFSSQRWVSIYSRIVCSLPTSRWRVSECGWGVQNVAAIAVANKLAPESPAMAYVLVVDDEPSIRRLLTRWLQGWGYAVQQASNATEALEVMLAEPASIMLCDIRMPGHDGLWLVERVRARWPRTAIIVATGVDDLQTVLQARREGVTDYVTKPFGRELLLQALGRANAALKE